MEESKELLRAAQRAARLAGDELRRKFDGPRTVHDKGGERLNLVTDADHASEELILEFLNRYFPKHAVLAEESGAISGDTFQWFVDPLDGTTNYAHRVPHYCVTLGVEGPRPDGSRGVLAGVVYDPMRDEMFSARAGAGATLNGIDLHVSQAGTMDEALLSTGFPYDVHDKPELPLNLFGRIIRKARGVRRMGSAALDLAYVACGRYDGFFEFSLKPWDLAAGTLLVAESGGRASRIDGREYSVEVADILAASQSLYDKLLDECRECIRSLNYQAR